MKAGSEYEDGWRERNRTVMTFDVHVEFANGTERAKAAPTGISTEAGKRT
jgi:hypothetical protein